MLVQHEVDHRTLGRRVELGAVGIVDAKDIPGVLDNGTLQTEAQTKERDGFLTRMAYSANLPLYPADAKTSGDYHPVQPLEVSVGEQTVDLFSGYPSNVHFAVVRQTAVTQRFDNGQVRVW
jgi:hypothetical protein